LSIGLEDGSSSSEIFLGCLGGLSSSLVWVVWESWSIEPDSGWALTPWSLFEGDTLDGSDEEEDSGEEDDEDEESEEEDEAPKKKQKK